MHNIYKPVLSTMEQVNNGHIILNPGHLGTSVKSIESGGVGNTFITGFFLHGLVVTVHMLYPRGHGICSRWTKTLYLYYSALISQARNCIDR